MRWPCMTKKRHEAEQREARRKERELELRRENRIWERMHEKRDTHAHWLPLGRMNRIAVRLFRMLVPWVLSPSPESIRRDGSSGLGYSSPHDASSREWRGALLTLVRGGAPATR